MYDTERKYLSSFALYPEIKLCRNRN